MQFWFLLYEKNHALLCLVYECNYGNKVDAIQRIC